MADEREAVVVSRDQRVRRTPACPVCDYDLTGVEGLVCPECGEKFSEADLDVIFALPRWRERFVLDSRGPVIAGWAVVVALAPLIVWGHHLARGGGKSFAVWPLIGGVALAAFGAGGGVVALLGSRATNLCVLRAMWLRTSLWLYVPWATAVVVWIDAASREAFGTFAIPFAVVAVGMAPGGVVGWWHAWGDRRDELEVTIERGRWWALVVLAVSVSAGGAAMSVGALTSALGWW